MGKSNPLQHDCNVNGCFVERHKFAIEDLAANLWRNNSFTDVDGLNETNGKLCFLEFKNNRDLGFGQLQTFQVITGRCLGDVVFIIDGEAPRTCRGYSILWKHTHLPELPATWPDLIEVIGKWNAWARGSVGASWLDETNYNNRLWPIQ